VNCSPGTRSVGSAASPGGQAAAGPQAPVGLLPRQAEVPAPGRELESSAPFRGGDDAEHGEPSRISGIAVLGSVAIPLVSCPVACPMNQNRALKASPTATPARIRRRLTKGLRHHDRPEPGVPDAGSEESVDVSDPAGGAAAQASPANAELRDCAGRNWGQALVRVRP